MSGDVQSGPERLVSLLSDIYSEKGVWVWLSSKNQNLNGYTPLALLLNDNGEKVMREADRISDRPDRRAATGARAVCPTRCDDDCDTDCHEHHQIPAKRRHDVDTCPGARAED